jgi:RNA polymerase sigma-70 factor (ECF subfamily)
MSTHTVTAAVADLLTIVPARDASAPEGLETPELRLLVEAAKAGDRDAFGRLVEVHERVVIRTAMAALGRREDAEDVAQEAFVVAWQKLAGFRGDATFRTWLLTIVWRRALDRRRARQRWWTRASSGRPDGAEDGTPAATSPDPERTAMGRETARRVAVEIGRLSPKLRDALLLSASGEHSYEEIARLLRVSVGTLKWRVSEARRVVAVRVGLQRSGR